MAKTNPFARLCFMLLPILIWGADALGQTPFSSKDERDQVLITAGRDGLIDQREWEANLTEERFFSDISWDYLSLGDVDGDSRVSVNEFYKYYEKRQTAIDEIGSESLLENDPLFFDAKPSRPAYNDSFVPELTDPEKMNQRVLFKRAHIAMLMKFSAMADPEMAFQANKKRSDRLKNIRYRRRLALNKKEGQIGQGSERKISIYRNRLVTDRFSQPSMRDALSVSPGTTLSSPTTTSDDETTTRSRHRAALKELKNKSQNEGKSLRSALNQELPSETLATEPQQEKPVHSRKVTDIRKLIPRRNKGDSGDNSSKTSKIREELKAERKK